MQSRNFINIAAYLDHAALLEDWLPESWSTAIPPRLLVAAQAGSAGEEVRAYARYVGHLLGAEVTNTTAALAHLPEQAQAGYDLTLFEEGQRSYLERLFKTPLGQRAIEQIPGAVLVARQPRWPLRRILFVTRGQAQEENALPWVHDLAQPSGATVTVLAILPPAPAYFSEALTRYGLTNWLQSGTPLGEQLRQLEEDLPGWHVAGRLRFRPGSVETQLKHEINESEPDLVIVAADSTDWWQKHLTNQLVGTTLAWIDRPLLVTK